MTSDRNSSKDDEKRRWLKAELSKCNQELDRHAEEWQKKYSPVETGRLALKTVVLLKKRRRAWIDLQRYCEGQESGTPKRSS